MNRNLPFSGQRPDVVWPPHTGPSDLDMRRYGRPLELWERTTEVCAGDTILEDLGPRVTAPRATLILARYETARVAIHAADGDWESFTPAIDIAAACDYLERVPAEYSERRWLAGVLGSISADGDVCAATVSRLAAAAAAADRIGHDQGAFALWRTAWQMTKSHRWHDAGGRVARAIARAAAAGGGVRSHRLWSRRARVVEGRARS
jgi:hypothetical protein